MILQALATTAAGIFAGAALYINLAEHPARLECGTQIAATVFGPSYRQAAIMQASLAVVGSLAGIGAWLGGGAPGWLIGAVALGAVVPFTLLVIMPTNRQLLAPGLNRESPDANALLQKWGRLHAVRTILGLAGFGIFVWSLGQ